MNTTESKGSKAEEKKRKEMTAHSARERCEAVLAVWTERRKPSQVCRKIGVTEGVLLNWQDRALRGMLEALEPRMKAADGEGTWLPPRLEKKLRRKAAEQAAKQTKLSRRLEKIQTEKEEMTTA